MEIQTLAERARSYRHDPETRPNYLAAQKKWRDNNKETIWAKELRKIHGITPEKYYEILKEQGGVCAICKGVNPKGKRLLVDHDRKCCATLSHWNGYDPRSERKRCGKCVRGLLCDQCNQGIGKFRDDAEALRIAADYVGRGDSNRRP